MKHQRASNLKDAGSVEIARVALPATRFELELLLSLYAAAEVSVSSCGIAVLSYPLSHPLQKYLECVSIFVAFCNFVRPYFN